MEINLKARPWPMLLPSRLLCQLPPENLSHRVDLRFRPCPSSQRVEHETNLDVGAEVKTFFGETEMIDATHAAILHPLHLL